MEDIKKADEIKVVVRPIPEIVESREFHFLLKFYDMKLFTSGRIIIEFKLSLKMLR